MKAIIKLVRVYEVDLPDDFDLSDGALGPIDPLDLIAGGTEIDYYYAEHGYHWKAEDDDE
jgi:hypothetical protein